MTKAKTDFSKGAAHINDQFVPISEAKVPVGDWGFTGEVLRVIALQGLLGPLGLINAVLMALGTAPLRFIMHTNLASAIGLVYLCLPIVVTVIYLIVTFIMAFNNLEISFYLLGATPTLPSVAWGALRYGAKPELYAPATAVNLVVILGLGLMFVLMLTGKASFGYRPERERAV